MLRINPVVPDKVLCVEEDPYLTDLFHYALGREGYAVDVTHSGAEALRAARLDPPDIILLNLYLPDVNGFLLCTWLRHTFHIPVIMLIPLGTDAEMTMAFEAGADDCLAKPFKMRILSDRIRGVLCRVGRSNVPGGSRKIIDRPDSSTFHAKEDEGDASQLWSA